MAALGQHSAGMLEMERMRRSDDDAIHRHRVQHLAIVLEPRGDAEGLLDAVKFLRAQPVDRHDLAVGQRLQHRDVVDDRPPPRADDANARLGAHSGPRPDLPMASSVARWTFRICATIAFSEASGSRAASAATIFSWSAWDCFRTPGVSDAIRRYSMPRT